MSRKNNSYTVAANSLYADSSSILVSIFLIGSLLGEKTTKWQTHDSRNNLALQLLYILLSVYLQLRYTCNEKISMY